MAAPKKVEWDTCEEDDCVGVRLPSGGRCWAHADDHDLDTALKRLGADGDVDARGVPITKELLERLLTTAPRDDDGGVLLAEARFDHATFHETSDFMEVHFRGYAGFDHATFEGTAWFGGATFESGASLDRAAFHSDAVFLEATFHDDADFQRTTFEAEADFQHVAFRTNAIFSMATFHAAANFHEATFLGRAMFHVGVIFKGDAWFTEATFRGTASFDEVTFQRGAEFSGAAFQRGAWFIQATFQQARRLGPMLVRKSLMLEEAVFHQRIQVEVAAAAVCCSRARFLDGVQLRVRWAQVVLDDTDLAAPSILSGVPPFVSLDEADFARAWSRLPRPWIPRGRPRLLSLRRADVAGLTISNIELRACRFAGAHNLDRLRVEESVFGYAPRGWRWTTRRMIAEEHQWRVSRIGSDRRFRWQSEYRQPPDWLAVEPLTAKQIAALYRALRKGLEDNKDEPGAAEFYYGEMEMRRHHKREDARIERRDRHFGHWAAAMTEHAVLWLYWLVSGYGLRAWRALTTFVVVLLVAAGLFAFGGGFASSTTARVASPSATTLPASGSPPSSATTTTVDTSFGGALVYSARTVIGLTRDPQPRLTRFGDVVQILIRILGPVLLGLAVLSVRGRVKR